MLYRVTKRDGKPTKVPINPNTGSAASTTSPNDWGRFDDTTKRQHKADGVGFVFTSADPFCGIDLDKCRDAETGIIAPWAKEIIDELDSYTEVSPSGTGVHVIVRSKKPSGRNRKGKIEIYDTGRYFCMTGQHVDGTPTTIEDRQYELDGLHGCIFPPEQKPEPKLPTEPVTADDAEILNVAMSAKNAAKFKALWNGDTSGHDDDASVADLALCNHLAFYCGPDAARIDRLFRQSGLMREKWNREDYRERTIGAALQGRTEYYKWNGIRMKNETNGALTEIPEPRTDYGNGRRLVKLHGRDLHYIAPWRRWIVWTGKRWHEDDICAVERLAKDVPPMVLDDAKRSGFDANEFRKYCNWAVTSQSAERLTAMLKMARSEPGVPILPKALDCDPWLLNVANGTIDLRTGKLREHRREDLITKIVDIAFDENAPCPRWLQFLEEVFEGNGGLQEFAKRAAGYSLTASTRERCLFFCFGSGANGKSTFVSTIETVAGSYATAITSEMLMLRRGQVHPTEVCDLAGRRLAVANETEDGRRLAESLVKQLTGGTDKLKGRRMREDFWEFDATFKLWLSGNHKPQIKGTDDAIWDRVKLIPFNVRFEKPDRDLPAKLLEEAPGILRWMVDGCLAWQSDGLAEPDEVRRATASYRNESDALGQFIDEQCVEGPNLRCSSKDLYTAYQRWCDDNGEKPESQKRFGGRMTERRYERLTNNGTWYLGIGLTERTEGYGT